MTKHNIFNKFYLYIRTIFNLKIIQLFYLVYYRIYRKIYKISYRYDCYRSSKYLKFNNFLSKNISLKKNTFIFLNIKYEFNNINEIKWSDTKHDKLWNYNLNYMDYLNQKELSFKIKCEIMNSYIDNFLFNKIGHEPYTISLRSINWIKFISINRKMFKKDYLKKIDAFLYSQYLILSKNIEYHIQANHLLENGFSLLFLSFYFNDNKIFLKSKKIILEELNNQILKDGSHYELSVMYHQFILDRLLDCFNLLKNNFFFQDQDLLNKIIKNKIILMVSWLKNMTFNNNIFPLFNDSVRNLSPPTSKILDYSYRLINLEEFKNVKLNASGYRRFKSEFYDCILDVGKIGPIYQPGHSHADTFNFELIFKKKPFITNYGISTYENSVQRFLERSTSFHNTVSIGNKNSSKIWHVFRVAKQAKVKILFESKNKIIAVHDGYSNIGLKHERIWKFYDNKIVIYDYIKKMNLLYLVNKKYSATANFWIYKDAKPFHINDKISTNYGFIKFDGHNSIRLKNKKVPDGFNKYSDSYKIETEFNNKLTSTIYLNEDIISN